MKSLIKWSLAGILILATAFPAMAASWVVCVDETKDARFSAETEPTVPPTPVFFTAAAPIYPGTTTTSSATKDCSPATLGASQVGTFFTLGGFVGGLPTSTPANANDAFYVIWHFRIGTGEAFVGAFDTTGVVRAVSPYSQTIIGSTNVGLVPTSGKATVTTLTTGVATVLAFKITTPSP